MPAIQKPEGHTVRIPFQEYLRDIDETPLLDADEEHELAWRIEEGDAAARDHMVRANLRLVVNIARGYICRGVALEDLVAEGNLGLLRAVEGFDPSLGVRFSTYASFWIKQSIKRGLMNTGKTIRFPAYMIELFIKWRRAAAELQVELDRQPAEEEVAGRLGLSAKKLKLIRKAIRIYNADSQEEASGAGPPLAELAGFDAAGPDSRMNQAEELRQVLGLLDRLDSREAAVLRLRYGLSGDEPRTLKEIGEHLGLTRERVRQIEHDGLRKLREQLEAA